LQINWYQQHLLIDSFHHFELSHEANSIDRREAIYKMSPKHMPMTAIFGSDVERDQDPQGIYGDNAKQSVEAMI
jgi:hypothetical protein